MDDFLHSAPLWLPWTVAMLALVTASGFFSASETALFYLSHDEVRAMRQGRSRERVAAALLANPDRLLTAILFWNLVVNLTYFAAGVVVAQKLARSGQSAAAGTFGLLSLFFIILLGEVMPKSIAVVFRRPLASLVSWPLAITVRLIDPMIPALGNISRVVRRTFWPKVPTERYLDTEDLERAITTAETTDELKQQERQVLHRILLLSELTVEEVMRPRGTYITLPSPVHLADLQGQIPAAGYVTLHPGNPDDVESTVPLLDFSALPERHLEHEAERVIHVPWCAKLADVLQTFRDRSCSLASVVNEYGETIGILTYDDIVDTVLAPDPSRTRRLLRREPLVEVASGRLQVEGITTLRYLSGKLGLEFDPDADALVTVAGLLSDRLERLPDVGDSCSWRGYRVEVSETLGRGQLRAIITAEQETATQENLPSSSQPHAQDNETQITGRARQA